MTVSTPSISILQHNSPSRNATGQELSLSICTIDHVGTTLSGHVGTPPSGQSMHVASICANR